MKLLNMKNTFIFSLILFWVLSTSFKSTLHNPSVVQRDSDKQRIISLLEGSIPIKWVFTGNSITQGAKHTHGLRAYPVIFSERVGFEMGRSRDLVVITAISGHNSYDILDDFDWRIAAYKPTVVVLMIGTNDAAEANNISGSQYVTNITQLVSRIRGLDAIPVLLSPTPIREDLAPERSNLELYVNALRIFAQENKVIFVDNWELWNTDVSNKYNGQISRHLLNDPLHPNGQGHKEIAISLFKELSIYDPTQPSGGAPYYEGVH